MPHSDCRRWVALGAMLVFCGAAGEARRMDLLELYARATEFDPTFQASIHERAIADAAFRESRAGLLPSLTADLSGSKTFQNIRSSDNILFTVGRSDFFTQQYSISLTQPLYRSEVFRRLPQARIEVKRAQEVYEAARQDLIFRLAQAHFNYLAARDNLDLAVAERTAIWQQLQETEQRLGSGLATATDAHEARARHALAQASEIEARDRLEEAREAIAEITGEVPFDLKGLSESFPLEPPEFEDVEKWVETALFQNPAVKSLRTEVEVAQSEIRRQWGARLPSIDFVASLNSSDTGGTVFGGGNEIGTTDYALRVGIPIYDGGRVSALARTAELRYRIALQNLERAERQTEREARTSFQRVMSGITRVEALEKSVFSHEAALASKEQGLRSGLNTGLAVLDARRDLFSARRDLAQARYLYILNRLRLKQTAGTLNVDDLRQVNAYLQ